jgi:hypothetical protein
VATGRIATFPADVVYEANWNSGPLQAFPPPLWTNITNRALGPWGTTHGVLYESGLNEAGEWHPALDNRDGSLDPGNAAGQYAPNVAPYKGCRIRMPFGVNQLTPDQATAGEQSGFLGQVPAQSNVASDAAYPAFSIAASGSAFQGGQVYQATLASGSSVGAVPIRVLSVPVVPTRVYSFQAQARIPSGSSASTQAAILWYDLTGTQIGSTVAGTASALTSGSSTWVQLAASGTAPVGAYSATLRLQIASGTLGANTTWQIDGLQWENSATPTPWQAPGTLGANLLPRAIATGLASIDPVKDSAANWFTPIAGSVAQANNLTAAPNGATTAAAWTTPSGTTSSSPLYCGVVGTGSPAANGPVADCVQVTATQTYTASAYLMRTSSADATVQVTVSIRWFNAAGTVLSASTGSAVTVAVGSWIRASVSAAAPAGAVWGRARIQISSPASTTASNTIYATGWQMEQAGSASPWGDPGPTFYAFWGFFEQLPQAWRLSGTWGETDAVGVDALAGLAQYQVQGPLIEEFLALSPTFLYALNDPVGSTSCADLTGNRIAAPVENSPFGAGSLVFGNSVTATSPSGLMQGSAGPVATFNNNPSETGSLQFPETFVSIHKTTVSPGPPANGNWTRIIHFRSATAPNSTSAYILWNAIPPSYGSNLSEVQFQIGASPPTGAAFLFVSGATGGSASYAGSANLCDGNWHQFAITCGGSGNIAFYVDGAQVGTGSVTLPLSGVVTDDIGASVQTGVTQYKGGVVGDIAVAAEFPTVLTAAQITNLYNSFRSASSGESSGARAARLFTWVGWTGPTAIDTGLTTSMGPATDLAGQSALNGLNAIVATENGDGYASNSGVLTFRSRGALYNSAPVFIFGEKQANGEWPYEDGLLPTDPIVTYNIVPITQYSTGQVATSQDLASQQANFPRTFPGRTVNSTSFAEVQAASQYQLGQSKTPQMRCTGLKLHASAIPGLFAVCAQLEKGVRIRVMKRPPWRSTAIQFDGFVTRTAWSFDPSGDVFLTVDAAPADLANYWVLGALHTTLSAQAASGQAQATINALPDAAVNALASSLPRGYQLRFEPGTARDETLTLAPTGIPATSLGYTTAVLTFTGNFAFTHPANSVVCEVLPAGYTDPTTWDASSLLGAASTTVISGGGSGTNTVTVGPLQDVATNPLGSTWNQGDTISLSPGTANAETAVIKTVAATVPGYTSCLITLTANLAHTHAAGDTVCDPLPAGISTPSALSPTTRLAY